MTKEKAKAVTIKVWSFLRDHSEIRSKKYYPSWLWEKVFGCRNYCPLCELFYQENATCPDCPLGSCNESSDYYRWMCAANNETRSICAGNIVEKVKAWEV